MSDQEVFWDAELQRQRSQHDLPIKWLNRPGRQSDVDIINAHRDELIGATMLADNIAAHTNLRPYRLLLPEPWGLSDDADLGLFWGMITMRAKVPHPLVAYHAAPVAGSQET